MEEKIGGKTLIFPLFLFSLFEYIQIYLCGKSRQRKNVSIWDA